MKGEYYETNGDTSETAASHLLPRGFIPVLPTSIKSHSLLYNFILNKIKITYSLYISTKQKSRIFMLI